MIVLDVKARLHCDQPGCEESIAVRLQLLPNGAVAPILPPHALGKWSIFINPRNLLVPFEGHCQFHPKGKIIEPGMTDALPQTLKG
jgi:hypothetical protein